MVNIHRGKPDYEASLENGVYSKGKPGDPTARAITFTMLEDVEALIFNAIKEG
jgi:hypothetical protein